MAQEEIKNLEKKIDTLVDLQRQEVVILRDTLPPTFSDVMVGMNRRLDEQTATMVKHVERHTVVDAMQEKQNQKMNDALARIEPFIKQAEEDRKFKKKVDETAQKITKWGTRWLVLTAIVTSIYYTLRHIK